MCGALINVWPVWGNPGISCEKYAGCGGAPTALAEVETIHYYRSLARSIGGHRGIFNRLIHGSTGL